MKKLLIVFLISLQVLFLGCQASKKPVSSVDLSYYSRISIDKRTKPDKEIEEFIKPYREQLNSEMSGIIGYSEKDMPATRTKTETLLGNFVSDVIFDTASKFMKVDCAITNKGGLRASVFKGNIKVSDIFKLMPFENKIVISKFTGKQLKQVVEEIVHDKGTPLSGLTIVANSGVIDAYINGKEIDESGIYYVATIDYVANGGGGLQSMWKGQIVKETNVLLREAIIEYIREKKVISPRIEGRVVIQ
jgi:2',3'-cyclic-nucleotide 2'-phosphodiesterase (5'-nucleotidase family)